MSEDTAPKQKKNAGRNWISASSPSWNSEAFWGYWLNLVVNDNEQVWNKLIVDVGDGRVAKWCWREGYVPMSEKSSTRMTCLMRWAGDRSRTECTVRSNTDHASLWKQITTLVAGKLSKYRPGSLHLLDNNSKRKKKNNIRLNTSFGTNGRVKSIEWSRRDTGKLKAVPLQLCQKKQNKTKQN